MYSINIETVPILISILLRIQLEVESTDEDGKYCNYQELEKSTQINK